MGKALVKYAIETRAGWKREEVIERMTTEMKALGITADMLSRQNDPAMPTASDGRTLT
jgi:hypothetical protein